VFAGERAIALLENAFPALNASREDYIRNSVEYVTRFSVGGIRALAQRTEDERAT
jgi:hypothetical protein